MLSVPFEKWKINILNYILHKCVYSNSWYSSYFHTSSSAWLLVGISHWPALLDMTGAHTPALEKLNYVIYSLKTFHRFTECLQRNLHTHSCNLAIVNVTHHSWIFVPAATPPGILICLSLSKSASSCCSSFFAPTPKRELLS